MIKVGVRMKDGSFRVYHVDCDDTPDKIRKLVLGELPDAKNALVLIPPRERFIFKLPEKVTV